MPKLPLDLAPLAVDVATAARLLSAGRSTIYERMDDGTLPSFKLGHSRRIPLAAIEALVAGDAA